jgi:hypothetical protein
MDLGEVGWGVVDWIGLAQDRDRWRALVNSVLNLQVPKNAGKLPSVLTTGGLSSGTHLQEVIHITYQPSLYTTYVHDRKLTNFLLRNNLRIRT